MSVEFYRESAGKFDSRTLSRETLSRWTRRIRRSRALGIRGQPRDADRPHINNSQGFVVITVRQYT